MDYSNVPSKHDAVTNIELPITESVSRGRLSISESTRRLLESMDVGQVREARNSLAQRRRGAVGCAKSTKETKSEPSSEEFHRDDDIEIEDFTSNESMDEPNNDKDGHHGGDDDMKARSIVEGADDDTVTFTATSVFEPKIIRDDEWEPQRLDMVIKPPRTRNERAPDLSQLSRTSLPDPKNGQPDGDWVPPRLDVATTRRRTKGRNTKGLQSMSFTATIQNKKFKPISSSTMSYDDSCDLDWSEDDDEGRSSPAKTSGWGFGEFWNKLTSSIALEGGLPPREITSDITADADGTINTEKASPIAKSKTKVELAVGTRASTSYEYYVGRGKKKANKGKYLQAVALFNLALIRQREVLGEDHIDCATTLNEIGVCWMMLSERYLALSAYEEALYIRQKQLGDGAMEVAETTSNIWMILHEERCEIMEKEVEEEYEKYGNDNEGD
ncbi:hypothetical protein ACHAXA_005370 [Cyclostephanos tholiformis]|uniref:Uncharacterized protein n=1 Tax=Cyclostephanos tholiformis TaxID=382380 RepID=A0ABD3RD53_9STRA